MFIWKDAKASNTIKKINETINYHLLVQNLYIVYLNLLENA